MNDETKAPEVQMHVDVVGLAKQYRDGGNVHIQSDAVVRAAKVIAGMGEAEAKAQSAAFVAQTGYPADALEKQVGIAKDKALLEWRAATLGALSEAPAVGTTPESGIVSRGPAAR